MDAIPTTEKEMYNQLAFYTLSLADTSFIHQHIIDAWAAQHADENEKPIKTIFALIGLYLAIEKNYTGKEVQRAHMLLARNKRQWPVFPIPAEKSRMTVFDIMAQPVGPKRDKAIMQWCASVWDSWAEIHDEIQELTRLELGNI